jgi:hypothetical protein
MNIPSCNNHNLTLLDVSKHNFWSNLRAEVKFEYLDVTVLRCGVGEVQVVVGRAQHADKCGGECSTRKNAFITELETSARTESKRMINHNTPQLSRMDLANHCAAFPELSRLNTRVLLVARTKWALPWLLHSLWKQKHFCLHCRTFCFILVLLWIVPSLGAGPWIQAPEIVRSAQLLAVSLGHWFERDAPPQECRWTCESVKCWRLS